MKFLAALVLLAPAQAQADRWQTVDERLLISSSDFTLRHQDIEDPFKFSLVEKFLDKPLGAAERARLMAEEIRGSAAPLELLRLQIKYLDLEENALAGPGPSAFDLGKLPGNREFRRAIRKIFLSMVLAQEELQAALATLPQNAREELADFLLPELTLGANKLPVLQSPRQTWWEKEATRLDLIKKYPLRRVLTAAKALAKTIERELPVLMEHAASVRRLAPAKITTPLGNVVVGTNGRDHYREQAFLIIDPGGDDFYDSEIAHANASVAVALDLAGSDVYLSSGAGQGSGIFGIGILADALGDDTYKAQNMAQGAALLGVGILWDLKGRDSYQAQAFAQGAGAWGAGLLLDGEGNDTYQTGYFGQGVGLPGGAGLLADQNGNDNYLAGGIKSDPRGWMEQYGGFRQGEVSQSLSQGFGQGWRDRAAGGIGILSDALGNDVYQIDYFGQGSGYWLGLGLLADGAGNDRYLARRYAQGAGAHFAAGVLLDDSGNDVYASWAVSQGAGHDYALGVLWDGLGQDIYAMDTAGFVQQGASNAGGFGLLLDAGGQDQHAANPSAIGSSSWDEKRQSQGIGLVIDAGGGPDWTSQAVSTKPWMKQEGDLGLAYWDENAWNFGMAVSSIKTNEPQNSAQQIGQENSYLENRLQAAKALGGRSQLSEYLALAGWWGGGGLAQSEAKFLLWKAAEQKNLPQFLTLLDPHDVFSIMNLEEVFALLGPMGTQALRDRLAKLDEKERSRALYLLGDLRAANSVEAISFSLNDPSPKARKQAARALARIADKSYVKKLENLLALSEPFKSQEVAQWLNGEEKITMLQMLFGTGLTQDEWQNYFAGLPQDQALMSAAQKAAEWLKTHNEQWRAWLKGRIRELKALENAAAPLLAKFKDSDRDVRRWAVVGLGRAEFRELCAKAPELLQDEDYTVRFAAVRALAKLGRPPCAEIQRLGAESSDPKTQALARKVLNALP